ncbi:MAG: DUF4926 domain-containing protein [Balneolaceae bacterium]|nr:DUF4926 domain-containing protein [Balneolaceae bacterium]MDR9410126.1 DUF4926 domain-containing protein [Balneolaceae bacterium]
MESIKELHTVALLKNIPEKNLHRGDVGTVVVDLSDTMAEVEFVDQKGRTSELATLEKKDLIRLRLEAVPV